MLKIEVLTQIYNREAYSQDLLDWYAEHEPDKPIKEILLEAMDISIEDIT